MPRLINEGTGEGWVPNDRHVAVDGKMPK